MQLRAAGAEGADRWDRIGSGGLATITDQNGGGDVAFARPAAGQGGQGRGEITDATRWLGENRAGAQLAQTLGSSMDAQFSAILERRPDHAFDQAPGPLITRQLVEFGQSDDHRRLRSGTSDQGGIEIGLTTTERTSDLIAVLGGQAGGGDAGIAAAAQGRGRDRASAPALAQVGGGGDLGFDGRGRLGEGLAMGL